MSIATTTARPTQASTTGWGAQALEEIRANEQGRPVLLTGARILTGDPVIGEITSGDVLIGGALLVGVGPGIITAAGDDAAIVVDCTGMTVVPAVMDALALHGHRRTRHDDVATLVPGNPADLAILPTAASPTLARAAEAVARGGEDVRVLFAGGEVVRWGGADLDETSPDHHAGAEGLASGDLAAGNLAADDPRLGMWIDTTGFLHQELTADGRYDETRGGRPHAFQGRFWLDGDRVDYLDDLGFWAFGEIRGEELHHAGYVLRRR